MDSAAEKSALVTELRHSEARLREANERVEMILDSITDNFFALSKDWRFRYLNKHAAEQMRVLGKDPAALIGKLLWEEFPVVPNEKALRRVMSERVAITDELFYPPLGEWVENRMYPSHDGGVVSFQGYITGRKRAEEKLRRSEAYLAEGQRISHTGSWAWNVSTGELYWSLEHFRICGVDPETFKPTIDSARQLIHPEDLPSADQAFFGATRERRDFERELRMVRPDGTIRYVRSLGHPVFDASGELTEYVGTIMDFTERKTAEDALRKASEELAHVMRAMTVGELTTSIAHELNQPLAAVVTNANAGERWLAAKTPNIQEAHAALRRISRDASRAAEVIARIRAFLARGKPRMTALHLEDVIRDVVGLVQGEARAKGMWLTVSAAAGVPPVVADRIQLQQVLLNLVVNAMEAMGAQPSPALDLGADRHAPHEVRVFVRDSGPGIDPAHAERIFDAFYTTKPQGLGMGLAISRSIIEAHGGRLWATANEGPGATFHFTLPL
jgi:PAS domain S-box-containing protein